MLTLEEEIQRFEKLASDYEFNLNMHKNHVMNLSVNDIERMKRYAQENRQLAEWLRELKAYREDTRFADLYERICIKRDDDRDYFARTKDQTYITRIAEKEMFIHMMQDMMFDRYGVEEVNADDT